MGPAGSCSQQPCTDGPLLTLTLRRLSPVVQLEWPLKRTGDPAHKSPLGSAEQEMAPYTSTSPSSLSSPPDEPGGPRESTGWASVQEAPPSTEHAGGGRFILLPILSFHLFPHVSHNIVRGGCHRTLRHDKSHTSTY